MEIGGLLKVVHALVGIGFVSGLVGRWVVLGLAQRARSINSVVTLTEAARIFERLVIVGSSLVLLLGVATAIAQGTPFLGPLQSSRVDWLFVSVLLYGSLIPLVPLIFLPRGKVFAAALDEARASGEVTPALDASFRDPVVRAAHLYELAAVGAILVLMIAKPF